MINHVSLAEWYLDQGSDAERAVELLDVALANTPTKQANLWISQWNDPIIINYRMNAGYLPPDHWVHTAEGGGRNLGEACYIYDLFTYITGRAVTSVHAYAISPHRNYYVKRDNFVALMTFNDGSVATLTYTDKPTSLRISHFELDISKNC